VVPKLGDSREHVGEVRVIKARDALSWRRNIYPLGPSGSTHRSVLLFPHFYLRFVIRRVLFVIRNTSVMPHPTF
jgi:hypothetical protein